MEIKFDVSLAIVFKDQIAIDFYKNWKHFAEMQGAFLSF